MQGSIKRYPYEQNTINFPDDTKVLNYRQLYNLSVTDQAEFQKFARQIFKNAADVRLFKQYAVDVPAYLKSIEERKDVLTTKLQELDATQKRLANEIQGHLDAAAQQDIIIADVHRQQEVLAGQFASKMDLGGRGTTPKTGVQDSVPTKKSTFVI